MKQPDLLKLMGQLDARYLEEALLDSGCAFPSAKVKEYHSMKHTQKKRFLNPGKLAAAIVLIFALALTACATGIVDSVIGKMAQAWAVPDEDRDTRYEAAAEKSNKEPETVNLTELSGVSMTMEESYYDGESLMIVYSLDSKKQTLSFDFGPEHAAFENLVKDEGMSLESLRASLGISGEEYQTLCEKLEADGKTGFTIKQTNLGDHVLLIDGTDIGPMTVMNRDGKFFMECQNGLPEEAKNRQQLELVFTVKCWDICFYADGNTIYHFYPAPQEETVVFTVNNCSK